MEKIKLKWAELKVWATAHKKVLLITGGVVLAVALAGGYYIWTHPKAQEVIATVLPKKKAKPKTKASPLTGVQLTPEQADRPIFGLTTENHPNSRPQSGLQDAGVVYEAVAEGGITRYLALYLDTIPNLMGPIRSVRTYFVDWALEFDAPIGHVGGNADALDLIDPLRMKSLNQFYNGGSYYRANDRYAPHNVYTTAPLMEDLLRRNGHFHPATFKPSPRTKKEKPVEPPTQPTINVDYSSPLFAVEYRYDASCNCYLRFMAGAAHIERNTGAQIKVKNVVVQFMPTSYGFTRIGEATVIMGTPGSGRALVFRDGKVITGTWKKTDHRQRTQLLDGEGKDIPLNRGNTWYSIVPTDKTVTY